MRAQLQLAEHQWSSVNIVSEKPKNFVFPSFQTQREKKRGEESEDVWGFLTQLRLRTGPIT